MATGGGVVTVTGVIEMTTETEMVEVSGDDRALRCECNHYIRVHGLDERPLQYSHATGSYTAPAAVVRAVGAERKAAAEMARYLGVRQIVRRWRSGYCYS